MIPSGTNKMGSHMPNTPGSINSREDIAFRSTGNWIGDAVRRAVRTCSHRRHHEEMRTIKPMAQTMPRAAKMIFAEKAGGVPVAATTIEGDTTKDSVKCSTTRGSWGGATCATK